MPPVGLSDALKKLRGLFQTRSASSRASQDHTTTAGIFAVSRPILALSSSHCLPYPLGPQEKFATIYRNTSDAAQTCLPPLQAAADVIPGVGSIIKGTIGGILSILQLVDRYIQNKGDLEKLTLRLHLLLHHIDSAPISRTTFEETMRLRLLSALQTTKSQLERMEKRIRGAPSLTQDIAGCIATVNNHLFEYMVLSQMQLQNDMFEMKASMVEYHSTYMHLVEDSAMSGSAARLPKAISRGYAVLVDATGREHAILLDHCRYLGQLDAMLSVVLFECRPDEAEIQRWYIERKLYDFVIYNKANSDVIPLTRESDIWSKMESGTRIVVRVIIEEVVRSNVVATYKCPCGTLNTVNARIEDVVTALQHGCTITCRHCERRFQITHARAEHEVTDNSTNATPVTESKYLIRNFLARQVVHDVGYCCQWLTGGVLCGHAMATFDDLMFHLGGVHDVRGSAQRKMDCQWWSNRGCCGKMYRRDGMRRHIGTHVGCAFPCTVCGKLFIRMDSMRAHARKQHGDALL